MDRFPSSKSSSYYASVSRRHDTLELSSYYAESTYLCLYALQWSSVTLEHACCFMRRPVHSCSRRSAAIIRVRRHIPAVTIAKAYARHSCKLPHVFLLHQEIPKRSEGAPPVSNRRGPKLLSDLCFHRPWRHTGKKRSWILTGTAALVMTCCSLPSTHALISSGLDVARVPQSPRFSSSAVAFFMAYLNLDLVIGSIHYRRQVSLLTGWIHHSAYSVLLWILLRHGLAHVFVGPAIMELPTFVLALAMLVPAARSDLLFTSLFFVTRILYHAVLREYARSYMWLVPFD